MEQKSNVQYRAEKEYKNSREKFSLLLREIISNSIHAVLIRQSKRNPPDNCGAFFDSISKSAVILQKVSELFCVPNCQNFGRFSRKLYRYTFEVLFRGISAKASRRRISDA